MRNTLLMEKLPLAIAIIVKSIGGPYLVSAQGRGAGTMIAGQVPPFVLFRPHEFGDQ